MGLLGKMKMYQPHLAMPKSDFSEKSIFQHRIQRKAFPVLFVSMSHLIQGSELHERTLLNSFPNTNIHPIPNGIPTDSRVELMIGNELLSLL